MTFVVSISSLLSSISPSVFHRKNFVYKCASLLKLRTNACTFVCIVPLPNSLLCPIVVNSLKRTCNTHVVRNLDSTAKVSFVLAIRRLMLIYTINFSHISQFVLRYFLYVMFAKLSTPVLIVTLDGGFFLRVQHARKL